jgi:transposase
MLLPPVRRTWAPAGKTPVLRHSYRHDRLSVISAVTVSPRQWRMGLYFRCHRKNVTGIEVVRFLQHLLRHLVGPVILLWDGSMIHRRQEVQAYLLKAHQRLHVYRFPGYAPELNPDEYVWTQTKQRLANMTPQTVDELKELVHGALKRLRRSQMLLDACALKSGLKW